MCNNILRPPAHVAAGFLCEEGRAREEDKVIHACTQLLLVVIGAIRSNQLIFELTAVTVTTIIGLIWCTAVADSEVTWEHAKEHAYN